MKAFYATGYNGSVLQLEDGRYSDTVIGDTSENSEPHDALETLVAEVQNERGQILSEQHPLFGDMDINEIIEYIS